MPADLVLYLNLSQQIPSARLVRSASELLSQAFPPLAAGETKSCELRLIDGDGEAFADYLAEDNSPRLLLWIPGPVGGAQLALVTGDEFSALNDGSSSAMTGWGFTLPVTSAAIANYLAGWSDPRPINVEISLSIDGAMKLLYASTGTLSPRMSVVTEPSSSNNGQEFMRDVTDAATFKALVTAGHSLPWVIATWEGGTWNTWTIRTRVGGDPDNATIASTDPTGLNWRVPNDADPSTNNVIGERTPIA